MRTPRTRSSSTRRLSAGKPVKRFTPRSSARSPIQRTISQMDATQFPWFRIVGGVGIRTFPSSLRRYTRSEGAGRRNGRSSSGTSGKSSRNGPGSTTAPERQCSPRPSLFSSTPISRSERASSSRALRASSIAPARPAGPAPTKSTSRGRASSPGSSRTTRRSMGSSGRWSEGRKRPSARSSPLMLVPVAPVSARGVGGGPSPGPAGPDPVGRPKWRAGGRGQTRRAGLRAGRPPHARGAAGSRASPPPAGPRPCGRPGPRRWWPGAGS